MKGGEHARSHTRSTRTTTDHQLVARRSLGIALALGLVVVPASAHLIANDRGTVHVVGTGVFCVLSVPVAALHGFDDDGDGLASAAELAAHHVALEQEVDRRFVVADGAELARTVRLDLVLSPEHDAAEDRAAHVVALKHAELAGPPRDLVTRCDLFGGATRAITLSASRRVEDAGEERESAELTPASTERHWFRGTAVSAAPRDAAGGPRAPASWVAALAIASAVSLVGVVTMARRRKSRRHGSETSSASTPRQSD